VSRFTIIIIIIIFDPGTQFPRNEKITLCNTKSTKIKLIIIDACTQFPGNEKNFSMQYKKVQKLSWNEPYSSSSFTKLSCSKSIVPLSQIWRVTEIKSWFLCHRLTHQKACDRV